MPDDRSGTREKVNRRSVLKSVGAVSSSTAILEFASQPGRASSSEKSAENLPDVATMRKAFATHGGPILEALSNRGIIENPTVKALGIEQVTASREDGEKVGHLSTFHIDGETYTGFDTIVSTETATAIVSVVPDVGQSMASIDPDSGEGVLVRSTGDDSVSTMSDGSCTGSKELDACLDLCDCDNIYEYYYLQRWCCPCGDGCTHCWTECPDAFGEACTEEKAWPCG